MLVFRLHSSKYPANNGKGAALEGGRWNRKGTEAIYTSSSRALAILEVLVHYSVLPRDFVMTEIMIPVNVNIVKVEDTGAADVKWAPDLGSTWTPDMPVSRSQEIAAGISAAVLSVPSAVLLSDRNYVINPAHPKFHLIKFSDPEPFQFDPRLKKTPGRTKRPVTAVRQ
jgi:RES domain-containing protein